MVAPHYEIQVALHRVSGPFGESGWLDDCQAIDVRRQTGLVPEGHTVNLDQKYLGPDCKHANGSDKGHSALPWAPFPKEGPRQKDQGSSDVLDGGLWGP